MFFCNSYDPDEDEWKRMPLNFSLRLNFSATCLQNRLIVAYKVPSKSIIINSFDPTTQQWTKLQSLDLDKSTRGYVEALAMHDELHILMMLNSEIKIHKYDMKNDKWSKVNKTIIESFCLTFMNNFCVHFQIASIDIGTRQIDLKIFFKHGGNYFFNVISKNVTLKYDRDTEKWIKFDPIDINAIGDKEIVDFVPLN